MDSSGRQQADQQVQAHTHDKQANINIDINGDSIDVDGVKNMSLDSSANQRVGLSKDELMKYANQPFWVRLRNILFISFWIVWFSILAAAIGYVINSPGCSPATKASAAKPVSDAISSTVAPLLASSSPLVGDMLTGGQTK